ncbi:hypothetical protein WN944_015212 [Citrus x changshan-huyou]|uniref:Uncharacterized protein n=1 Tax=Citrus x changshan-huyou TaxID=2935761 RepID=A0AAP0QQV5_9ROSI
MRVISNKKKTIGRAGPRARPLLTIAEDFDTDKLCLADDSITTAKACILLKLNFEKQWKGFTEDLEIRQAPRLELRIACTVAQMEREGDNSPRVSSLAQVRDAGNLLTRAGFTLPSVDVDQYTVKYNSALELIQHLRAMGETNALLQRNEVWFLSWIMMFPFLLR